MFLKGLFCKVFSFFAGAQRNRKLDILHQRSLNSLKILQKILITQIYFIAIFSFKILSLLIYYVYHVKGGPGRKS